MAELEDKLIEDLKSGKDVSLERALLIVSGCRTEEEIAGYVEKLNQIQQEFREHYQINEKAKDPVAHKAKMLFDYLWETKPDRSNTNSLLTDVIDAQLSEYKHEKIGDCVGLTSLYTVMGLREELNLSILVSDKHTLNRLRTDYDIYDIDNRHPLGFDFHSGFDYQLENFKERFVMDIVPLVLNNRGLIRHKLGDFKAALNDYNKAIELYPYYSFIYNNRGNAKRKLRKKKSALVDYDKAIELNPKNSAAYSNRGISKSELGDKEGAIKDCDRAIELNPKNSEVYSNRGIVKSESGDDEGAIEDYDRAIELDPEYSAAYYNRGISKWKTGDYEGALNDYDKVIEINPKEYTAYISKYFVKIELFIHNLAKNMNPATLVRKAIEYYKEK